MKKSIFVILPVLIFSITGYDGGSQTTRRLTLDQVLQLARDQSPDAILAKHRFRGNYWQFRSFKAKYRPSLNLTGELPRYSHRYTLIPDPVTGKYNYVETNSVQSSLELNLRQNVGFTGGTITLYTDLQRNDEMGDDPGTEYVSTPLSIRYQQAISAYNPLKWEKRIEPVRYEEAKKNYINSIEMVHRQAVNLFFNLALAQLNMEISGINYSNADTLYRIAQGRYNIGTIAEDELLQMELRLLNAGTDLNQAGINLQISEFQLRSFLGFNETVKLELIIPSDIPELEVDMNKAVSEARNNNPEILSLERQLLEAAQNVAQARSEKGLNADLFASFGLTQQTDARLPEAYQSPFNQTQIVNIGFEMPILDWGMGRGQYRMAQSQEEVVRTQVQQAEVDFEQNILLNVMEFNLQDDQLLIAAKADTIAQKRYDVTKQRFLIGKIDVLDLNIADSEKDVAKRGYISALRNYWSSFYDVRRLTLYDFIRDEKLAADFDTLVE
ncbi:MAG: TolC family protein [Bacteroidales bacterium]|nr:MAG: TolC family protein [Bacteroidales bacterium]